LKKYHFIFVLLLLTSLGCRKNNDASNNNGVELKSIYLSAVVDGAVWDVKGSDQAYFETISDGQRNTLLIAGINNSLAPANGAAPMIFISFDFIPKLGRYYFNNQGDVQSDSGTSATYSPGGNSQPKWSTGGYVDIDSVSEQVITGAFNFMAAGGSSDTTATIITQGQFEVLYVGGSGQPLH
jgi:hypothetical protein